MISQENFEWEHEKMDAVVWGLYKQRRQNVCNGLLSALLGREIKEPTTVAI